MLLPEPKELPNFWATTLDEVFAVRVGPNDKLHDLLGPVAVAVAA
jgi:hypothetical protein